MGIRQSIDEKRSLFKQSVGVLAWKPFIRFLNNDGKDWAKMTKAKSFFIEDRLIWLRKPLKRQAMFSIQNGRYSIRVYDQPGRWMNDDDIRQLFTELRHVAADSMEKIPKYGVFMQKREAFANRIIALAYDNISQQAVGFTAMVYLPFQDNNKQRPIIHLGLTMIRRSYRGHRLQTPLFKKIFLLALLNQRCLSFTMTNIAASPAGIGATSDYFVNVFPNYKKTEVRTRFHVDVAKQVLANYREEFGCSKFAVFDPENFVVHGSNQPEGGGAVEFIKDDPVSWYRIEACNAFCKENLDYQAGDEMFQVGKVDFFLSSWASRKSKRRMKQLIDLQNQAAFQNG